MARRIQFHKWPFWTKPNSIEQINKLHFVFRRKFHLIKSFFFFLTNLFAWLPFYVLRVFSCEIQLLIFELVKPKFWVTFFSLETHLWNWFFSFFVVKRRCQNITKCSQNYKKIISYLKRICLLLVFRLSYNVQFTHIDIIMSTPK